jgi:hypothetical protein
MKQIKMNLFTFLPFHTLNFRLELLNLLRGKGFKAWLEQDGNKNQIATNASLEEIDWVTDRKNFFVVVH